MSFGHCLVEKLVNGYKSTDTFQNYHLDTGTESHTCLVALGLEIQEVMVLILSQVSEFHG
jgi:hypothetical protein